MVIFIYGEDRYSSHEYLNRVIEKFKQKHDPKGENVVYFDLEESSWDAILVSLSSSGLFSLKKLVVLKNIFSNKECRDFLGDYLENNNLSEDVFLVIYESKAPDKRLSLFKHLEKDKNTKSFSSPDLRAVERIISDSISKRGKKISPDAVRSLALIAGTDTYRAHNEAQKLSFLDKDEINIEDILSNTLAGSEEDIWKFIDALSLGDKKTALSMIDSELDSSDSPQQFLGTIIRQIRLLIALHSAKGADSEFAQNLGIHPFAVKKIRSQTRRFTIRKLQLIYMALCKLDRALKSSKGSPKLLFTVFIDSVMMSSVR